MTDTAADSNAIRDSLPDHASDTDTRGIGIDRVGIRDLDYPIVVLDKHRKRQSTVAKVTASVSLPKKERGTHMSRFVEVLNTVHGEVTVRNLPDILRKLQARLETDAVQLDLEFPYFISKQAPVSGAESLMKYDCAFLAKAVGAEVDFVLRVKVPVTTLCPCSKAISKYGAHNQRGVVSVSLRTTGFAWIEDVVQIVESCGSAPLFALLKREDEKAVTEMAYENPRFVEDLIREASARIRDELGACWLHIAVENAESIHDHAAFAELTWPQRPTDVRRTTVPGSRPTLPSDGNAIPGTFGRWLTQRRESRGYSQAEFARVLGLSPSHLSRLERDEKRPSEALVEIIASHLGIDPWVVGLRAGHVTPELASLLADRVDTIRQWTSTAWAAPPPSPRDGQNRPGS